MTCCGDMRRKRRSLDRFYRPLTPQKRDRERGKKLIVIGRKEETISVSSLSPRVRPSLEKRRDRARRSNLFHSVQVANVKTEFECRCCHDKAVRFLNERGLSPPSFIQR